MELERARRFGVRVASENGALPPHHQLPFPPRRTTPPKPNNTHKPNPPGSFNKLYPEPLHPEPTITFLAGCVFRIQSFRSADTKRHSSLGPCES